MAIIESIMVNNKALQNAHFAIPFSLRCTHARQSLVVKIMGIKSIWYF
jgi:hypothetical protein